MKTIYALLVEFKDTDCLKIGITNSIEQRHKTHEETMVIKEDLWSFEHKDAEEIEYLVKSLCKDNLYPRVTTREIFYDCPEVRQVFSDTYEAFCQDTDSRESLFDLHSPYGLFWTAFNQKAEEQLFFEKISASPISVICREFTVHNKSGRIVEINPDDLQLYYLPRKEFVAVRNNGWETNVQSYFKTKNPSFLETRKCDERYFINKRTGERTRVCLLGDGFEYVHSTYSKGASATEIKKALEIKYPDSVYYEEKHPLTPISDSINTVVRGSLNNSVKQPKWYYFLGVKKEKTKEYTSKGRGGEQIYVSQLYLDEEDKSNRNWRGESLAVHTWETIKSQILNSSIEIIKNRNRLNNNQSEIDLFNRTLKKMFRSIVE